ncbi:MAG: hypothetical protein F9K40_20930 [Kofleriaceae bacterium]|nr:MAG: hypothetical protein F9K40_20930 [Kofleriaceae bacterium]MBZ0231162.1 hypothetical protein [Kofleriaceae bacterium]
MRWMVTFGLAAALFAACGGKKSSTTPGEGDGEGTGTGTGPVITAQTLLGWGITGYDPASATPKTQVFLEVTDHHGQTRSYPLGDVAAPCAPGAGNADDIITTLFCAKDGAGAEFRAVYRGGAEIIVLRRWVSPGDDPADVELSFQEVSRVPVATGSKVKPAS